ncbi:MAG: diguanylate cyclase [Lachnospiraceae bacterium]|nr:diguanylate cyclase [Lachnospiraceae bacterium]
MKHILIVDDDSMSSLVTKSAVCKEYRVTEVSSGEAALAFLENEIPDLILMDIEMPGMNGKAVASRLKENEKWAKIPIIFLTADADPTTEAECLQCGADDFITKPFAGIVVSSRVSRILELQEFRKNLELELEKQTQQMKMATLKSLTDALTGLHNRDYLEKSVQERLKNGHSGALFMLDLDNFKAINDTFGHIVGDKTLQHFAEVLKKHARESDIVCRLAGDEFVIFCTDLEDKKTAAKKAEGIIRTFSDKMGALGYGGIVSVSIGIVMARGGAEYQSLYSKADKSLYFVKNNGKNAYHFYDESKRDLEEISTVIDLEYIQQMMQEGLEIPKGAFHLAYDEFKKLYDFVQRCVERKKQLVQTVLFTLDYVDDSKEQVPLEALMGLLEESVVESLRAVDAGTRYSNSQYIVLLLDTDITNGRMVAERVMRKFRENVQEITSNVKISYDIQPMEPKVAGN